jgi:hypothetical protein
MFDTLTLNPKGSTITECSANRKPLELIHWLVGWLVGTYSDMEVDNAKRRVVRSLIRGDTRGNVGVDDTHSLTSGADRCTIERAR